MARAAGAARGANKAYGRDYRIRDDAVDLRTAFETVETASAPWVRRVPVEQYLTYLASTSYVEALRDELPAFLDRQRAVLNEAFPDGVVVEPYRTDLWVARA